MKWSENAKDFMRDQWATRQRREKRIIIYGACIVTIIILYAFVWSPLSKQRNYTINQLIEIKQNIPIVIRGLGLYKTLREQNLLPANKKIAPINKAVNKMLVQQQLVPFGIKLTTLSPSSVKLSFQQSPFDFLIMGFESLVRDSIFVSTIHINRSKNEGLVSGTVVLTQVNSSLKKNLMAFGKLNKYILKHS